MMNRVESLICNELITIGRVPNMTDVDHARKETLDEVLRAVRAEKTIHLYDGMDLSDVTAIIGEISRIMPTLDAVPPNRREFWGYLFSGAVAAHEDLLKKERNNE